MGAQIHWRANRGDGMNEAEKRRLGDGLADLLRFADKYEGMPGILENVEKKDAN